MTDVRFLPAAKEELWAAAEDYDTASAGLGEEFILEVERGIARIAALPDHGSPYFAATRRIVLRRFPYDVVYRASHGDLVVVAVAHQHREPFYWRERLR